MRARRPVWLWVAAAAVIVAAALPTEASARRLEVWIHGGEGVTLTVLDRTLSPSADLFSCDSTLDRTQTRIPPPGGVIQPGYDGGGWVCRVGPADLVVTHNLRIGSSDYVLWAQSRAPLVGQNATECQIRHLGSDKPAPEAPYECQAVFRYAGEADPITSTVVTRRTPRTVTDPAQQRALFVGGCVKTPENCIWQSVSSEPAPYRGPSRIIQAGSVDCDTSEEGSPFTREVATGSATAVTFGGDASFSVEAGLFSGELSLAYDRTVTDKVEDRAELAFTLDRGMRWKLELVPDYYRYTGNLTVSVPADVPNGPQKGLYYLPDLSVDEPRATGAVPQPDDGSGGVGNLRVVQWPDPACKEKSAAPPLCVDLDEDAGDDAMPLCEVVRPQPAADDGWCRPAPYDAGACPPRELFSVRDGSWPAPWSSTGGIEFAWWGARDRPQAEAVTCPAGTSPTGAGGDGSIAATAPDLHWSWRLCVTDDTSTGSDADDASPADVTPPPADVTPPAADVTPAAAGSAVARAAAARRRGADTIYVSLPLSDRSGDAPRDLLAAVRLAFADHGRRADGRRLRLRVLSDADPRTGRWSAARTRANARRAASDPRTLAYVGEASSGATAVAVPILNRAGVLTVSPSSTAVDLTTSAAMRPSGRRTFARVIPNDLSQAAALAQSMRDWRVRRVFVVQDGSAYGRDLAALFAAHAASHFGVRVVGRAGVPSTADERLALAGRVRGAGAQAVLFAGLAQSGAEPTIRALTTAMPRLQVFGGDGLTNHPELLRSMTVGGADGPLRLTSPALLPSTLPRAGRSVFRRVWARTGRRPDAYAVYAYEAMDAVLDAADRAGIGRLGPRRARAATRRAFFAIRDRRSPIGRYSIRPSGDTTMSRYGQFTVHRGVLHAPQCLSCGRGRAR